MALTCSQRSIWCELIIRSRSPTRTYRKAPLLHHLDYEFLRMPFGLRNAAQTFQRFIESVVRELDFVHSYIDDILVASSSKEEYRTHLQLLSEQLKAHKVTVNPDKCIFMQQHIDFLGHQLDSVGIRHLQDRVKQFGTFLIQRLYSPFDASTAWSTTIADSCHA
ncbi:unnamed protein product, partial [Dicrocoelium dendriticum]